MADEGSFGWQDLRRTKAERDRSHKSMRFRPTSREYQLVGQISPKLCSTLKLFLQALYLRSQSICVFGVIVQFITFLFLATCLFCWFFTSNCVFGPIVTLVSFLSGLLLISFLGVAIINEE